MLKIVALIAVLFSQLVAETSSFVTRAMSARLAESGSSDTAILDPGRTIPSAMELGGTIARSVTVESPVEIAARGTSADAARRSIAAVCGSMTAIQRFERRIRHDQVRLRGGKEVS
jgi:hypothetical protein